MRFPQTINTRNAAKAFDSHPATLQHWARTGTGPVKPIKIGRRLRWPVEDIQRVLEGVSK
jgi:predicted DNA-binding transcriptional regulator AlpA